MKIRVELNGEGDCSTIVDMTVEQYEFMKMIVAKMGDEKDESYSPSICLEEVSP